MDNYTIGDLTDVVRASGGCPSSKLSHNHLSVSITNNPWQFPTNHSSNSSNTDDSVNIEPPLSSMDDSFGDPFSDMRDPLLHGSDSVFFNSNSSSMASQADMIDVVCGDDVFVPNMFTRMLHVSAVDSNPGHNHLPVSLCCESPVIAASPVMKEITINNSGPSLADMNLNKSKSCLMDSTQMQISSPSNSGIKRRKSQVKKVVCIPAPVTANSRSTGEVVPSDLWAWRKYGQKPIKGSPYPRGYYRCSSSKGCSARKQVERSRTDPNMLVITYTSEHNHPWPTQRNALAGSSRSQPLKNSNSNSMNNSKGSDSQAQNYEATAIPKEQKETDNGASNTTASIKVEVEDSERNMEIDVGREFSTVLSSQFYRPSDPGEANHTEDFFADLGEIDGDPLHLLLDQGFGGDGRKDSKGSDPFGVFDWPEESNLQFGVQ